MKNIDCWIIEAFLSSLFKKKKKRLVISVIEFVRCLSVSASHALSRCPDVLHGKLSIWL